MDAPEGNRTPAAISGILLRGNDPYLYSSVRAELWRFLADGMLIVVAVALAKLVLHLCFNNRYGYFRNEFDYLACGNHLAWGYVDQPPLLP